MADTYYNNTRPSLGAILNDIFIGYDKLRNLMRLEHKRTLQLQGQTGI
jgi:hypothetical protein